jgi:hypothetical protein
MVSILLILFQLGLTHPLASIVAKGHVVLPKSVTPARIESNLKAAQLDASDVEKLDSLAASGKQHRFIKPAWRECSRHCVRIDVLLRAHN